MKKFKDGIYAHSTRGGNDQLLFRRAKLMGKLYLAYVKGGNLVALREWEDVSQEMESGGPYLNLSFDENGVIVGLTNVEPTHPKV